jgi:hypothetical protein
MKVNPTALSTTIASSIPKLSVAILLTLSCANPSLAKLESAEIVGNPTVNEDRVTVRIKVKENGGKPALNLTEGNFRLNVDGNPVNFNSGDWKSAKEATPPPVWIVFLLDYSGSMQQKDTQGKTKLKGAIDAIREFVKLAAKRSGNPKVKISIVTFGERGDRPCNNHLFDRNKIGNFLAADSQEISTELENLEAGKPCATTNIYDPVTKTLDFFNNPNPNPNDNQFPGKEGQDRLRTSIILLSDGYHNKPNEQATFDRLISTLKAQNSVIIHTLGYGITPEELGKKAGLNRPARRSDVGTGKPVKEDEFVDRDRLKAIADATGGVAEFSSDAVTVSKKLELFLDAILGEYEISYTEPNPVRGSSHNVAVRVSSGQENPIQSPSKPYRILVFGRSLPLQQRLLMLLGIGCIMLIGGGLPFWLWGKQLKREA